MHSLLEAYLGKVAGHLAGLPTARRQEELREMRTHLENAVIVGREMGRTEDEAVREALAQFGPPGMLGNNLAQAWRREQALNRRSLLGAAACTVGTLFLMNFLVVWPLMEPYLTHTFSQPVTKAQMDTLRWAFLGSQLLAPTAAAVVTATVFPRKAVSGAMFGVAVYLFWCWGRLAFYCATDARSSHLNTLFFVGQALQNVEVVLATSFVAWGGSRLRLAVQRRRFSAAAK